MATIVENKRNQDPFPDVVIPTRTVVAVPRLLNIYFCWNFYNNIIFY